MVMKVFCAMAGAVRVDHQREGQQGFAERHDVSIRNPYWVLRLRCFILRGRAPGSLRSYRRQRCQLRQAECAPAVASAGTRGTRHPAASPGAMPIPVARSRPRRVAGGRAPRVWPHTFRRTYICTNDRRARPD